MTNITLQGALGHVDRAPVLGTVPANPPRPPWLHNGHDSTGLPKEAPGRVSCGSTGPSWSSRRGECPSRLGAKGEEGPYLRRPSDGHLCLRRRNRQVGTHVHGSTQGATRTKHGTGMCTHTHTHTQTSTREWTNSKDTYTSSPHTSSTTGTNDHGEKSSLVVDQRDHGKGPPEREGVSGSTVSP